MTKTIDALVDALEAAMDGDTDWPWFQVAEAAIARARAEQAEPVAEVREEKRSGKPFIATLGDAELEPGTKLYTTPPAAPAKLEPLTDAEIQRAIYGIAAYSGDYETAVARAVEADHNAKLGGAA